MPAKTVTFFRIIIFYFSYYSEKSNCLCIFPPCAAIQLLANGSIQCLSLAIFANLFRDLFASNGLIFSFKHIFRCTYGSNRNVQILRNHVICYYWKLIVLDP